MQERLKKLEMELLDELYTPKQIKEYIPTAYYERLAIEIGEEEATEIYKKIE